MVSKMTGPKIYLFSFSLKNVYKICEMADFSQLITSLTILYSVVCTSMLCRYVVCRLVESAGLWLKMSSNLLDKFDLKKQRTHKVPTYIAVCTYVTRSSIYKEQFSMHVFCQSNKIGTWGKKLLLKKRTSINVNWESPYDCEFVQNNTILE